MRMMRHEARRAALRRLITRREVGGQEQLRSALAKAGHRVTQATVSRDLAAIGALKTLDDEGGERWTLPVAGDDLTPPASEVLRLMREFVLDVAHCGNLAIVRTGPGSAAPVASALDRSRIEGLLATVAGDDTVLAVATTPSGGRALARRLERLLTGRGMEVHR